MRACLKLSTVSERTVAVSRWFHSTIVLTKNECFNCPDLQCSAVKFLLLFDECLSKMFVFFHNFQIFSLSLGVFVWRLLEIHLSCNALTEVKKPMLDRLMVLAMDLIQTQMDSDTLKQLILNSSKFVDASGCVGYESQPNS